MAKLLPHEVRRSAEALLEACCERRVPLRVRDRGRSVTLVENRAPWSGNGSWVDIPRAQFRYDAGGQRWTLYAADRNGRRHVYDKVAPTPDLPQLLAEVERDTSGIFFG
jgi:hypothetical protein